MTDVVDRLLDGAVDLHVHPYPSPFPRRMDAAEAAQRAADAGMRAIVGNQTTLPPIARQRLTAWGLSPPTCVLSAIPPKTSIPEAAIPCSRSAATSIAVSW